MLFVYLFLFNICIPTEIKSPKALVTEKSALYAYSESRLGFGTTTLPGSESNTFPTSSIFGALKPVDAFAINCHVSSGL